MRDGVGGYGEEPFPHRLVLATVVEVAAAQIAPLTLQDVHGGDQKSDGRYDVTTPDARVTRGCRGRLPLENALVVGGHRVEVTEGSRWVKTSRTRVTPAALEFCLLIAFCPRGHAVGRSPVPTASPKEWLVIEPVDRLC